jgi:hypothetical protein
MRKYGIHIFHASVNIFMSSNIQTKLEDYFVKTDKMHWVCLFPYPLPQWIVYGNFQNWILAKGQIISKGLIGIYDFSQKTNVRIRRKSKNKFVRWFFGRIWGYQKSFRNYLTSSDFFCEIVTFISRLSSFNNYFPDFTNSATKNQSALRIILIILLRILISWDLFRICTASWRKLGFSKPVHDVVKK